jgi:hypothetical protein
MPKQLKCSRCWDTSTEKKVGGHSYGAFMTANLLHSNLFLHAESLEVVPTIER